MTVGELIANTLEGREEGVRTPAGVAQQIQAVVPEEHKERFTRLISSFSYKAIEQQGSCWACLATLCNELLGGLSLREAEEWQIEMVSLLTRADKEVLLAAAGGST